MNFAAILGLISAGNVLAQGLPFRPHPAEGRPIVRVDADLVLVPVTVTDRHGAVVANLTRGDFLVTEAKRPQEVVSFSHETAPVSLGIVVDLSGSMANKIGKVQAAVQSLLAGLEAEDEEFLVTFADRPALITPFTSDPSQIQSAFAFAQPFGSTALFDAVALAVQEMHHARNGRRVIFVISDGGDNDSRFSEREMRHLLDEREIQIHAIGIHDGAASREEARGAWILEDLAAMTGGQHHMVESAGELPALAARMSRTLHDRYILGYVPTPLGPSGQFRRIDVKLTRLQGRPRLYLYTRRGYRVP